MNPQSDTLNCELEDWILGQPIWIQYAARDLLKSDKISDSQIAEFVQMVLSEIAGSLLAPSEPLSLSAIGVGRGGLVRLESLSNFEGVGQLNPRNPLVFGSENLSIVYGANGSGKTSFVRILKNACGAREVGDIYSDIFTHAEARQRCLIAFSNCGAVSEREWSVSEGAIQELSTIDIFDTGCGRSYLSLEAEASYEPRSLVFLSGLVEICDRVSRTIVEEIGKKVKALPDVPAAFRSTVYGRWLASISFRTGLDEIDGCCQWTEENEKQLVALDQYLSERSPKDRAKEIEEKKSCLARLLLEFKKNHTLLSDDAFRRIAEYRNKVDQAQKVAELAAQNSLTESKLDGVGTEEWLALWSVAKKYSVSRAYPVSPFPNTADGARCVLCHEELSSEGRRRLKSFEEYVIDDTAETARKTKSDLAGVLNSFEALPSEASVASEAIGAGLNEEQRRSILEFYKTLASRREALLAGRLLDGVEMLPKIDDWIASIEVLSNSYASESERFLHGFSEEERIRNTQLREELLMRKWMSQQEVAIKREVERLREVSTLDKARELCATRSISVKKSSLAEAVITPAYIKEFNSELEKLGAREIRVVLVKTRASKGKALHQVRLRDAIQDKPIQDVLSEGEHRVVCLAAFLADVSSKPNDSTFIFDDPISSLDVDYEESTAGRLVELAHTRQVIVFTHRLSLVRALQEISDEKGLTQRLIHIRSEPWGKGEPGTETADTGKPNVLLNEYLPRRIREAAGILEKEGNSHYAIHALAICTETRKVIERIIEIDLLADVVQRYRRAINTQGKLQKVAYIEKSDCDFLEEMMTKFSRIMHAQPEEAPTAIPKPDELMRDIERLQEWRRIFAARIKASL